MSTTEILVICGEPPWPPVHGGRIRITRLVEALASRFAVCVLAPASAPPPAGLAHEQLPDRPPAGRRAAFGSTEPALGRVMLGPRRREAVVAAARRHRPAALLVAQSPVAAVVPPLGVPTIVDFHDVEVDRLASLARRGGARKRLASTWEWAKARRWEPAVARRAALAVAVTSGDAAVLSGWGANVVWIPHGADRTAPAPSPARGPVTFVGSMGYAPNLDGARFLIDEVWPRVRASEPEVALRIVGSQAERTLGRVDGVEVVSDAEDAAGFYDQAALVVAPVREGGGMQIKVAEALARGRAVVATPHSLLSVPPAAAGAAVVGASAERFAELVVRLWRDLDERRVREQVLEAPVIPSWEEATRPLLGEVEQVVRGR